MASEIRVNQIQNRSGLGTITVADSGVVISGITTISDLRTSGNTIVAAGTTAAPSISPTGDSNTGIFFPSADTVAIAEGGVEALRVDSSGNLGIGTNSVPNWAAGGFLAVQNKTASLVSSGSQDAFLTSNAYYDGAWKYQNTGVARNIYMNSDGLVFRMAPSGSANASITWTEAARFNNTGNLVFPSGQGIDFSATANSSGTMTSELLDDYEEGSFTPTITGDGFTRTYNSTYTQGRYTKIGRVVTIEVAMYVSSQTGTANGSAPEFNLPFASSSFVSAQHWSLTPLRLAAVASSEIAKIPVLNAMSDTTALRGYYQLSGINNSTSGQVINTSTWGPNYQIGYTLTYVTN